MIIKTKDFAEAANKIVLALGADKSIGNLELVVKNSSLYMNVTNREFYVAIKFDLAEPEEFRAVVDANLFLNLISGITTETIEIKANTNYMVVKSGKSQYKLAMIYDNNELVELPPIFIQNKTVEMPISLDILSSILNVNSKEITKVKNLDVNELSKLYFIDETGCFTFTTGACLNSFTLDKPVKLLFNDKIVKLFKLFKEDVGFSFGYDAGLDGQLKSKVVFQTPDTYVAAIINCDDILVQKMQGYCTSTKHMIEGNQLYHVVLSTRELSEATSRLMMFAKNSSDDTKVVLIRVDMHITPEEVTITDSQGNTETVTVENGSTISEPYDMTVGLNDLKSVIDTTKAEHVTLNCGNRRAAIISRGPVSNLIKEFGNKKED